MNPMVLVIAVIVAGVVGNRLIRRLHPTVSRQQIYSAIAACVGGTLIVAGRTPETFWWYTGLFIAVVMGTFLITEWLNPRSTPPSTS